MILCNDGFWYLDRVCYYFVSFVYMEVYLLDNVTSFSLQ